VWAALTVAVGARLAVQAVGGAQFLPTVQVLAVQGIALGATFVSAVWGYALLSLRLHRLILVFNLAMLALLTTLVALLTPLDGAQGAAIGIAVAEVAGAIAGGVLLVRRRPHLAPRLRVIPRVGAAALLGATPALAHGIPVLARVLLSTAIYLAVVLALKTPPDELYEALPAWLRRGN
jgi:O-antigen/teichoic acid export membrane protein